MARVGVYVGAGAAFAVAVALAVARVGERAGALSNWQALVLGIVQGLTELLPISSSGHLILVPWLGDWTYLEEHDDFNQTFDVALHLGTLAAVVFYFWGDIVQLARAWLRSLSRRRIEGGDERIAWLIVAATIPAAIVGGIGEDVIALHLGSRGRSRSSSRSSASSCGLPTGRRRVAGWPTSASGPRSPSASRRASRSPPVSRARE